MIVQDLVKDGVATIEPFIRQPIVMEMGTLTNIAASKAQKDQWL